MSGKQTIRYTLPDVGQVVDRYFSSVAAANGVGDVSQEFRVNPVFFDALHEQALKAFPFLQKINTPLVLQDKGELLYPDWFDTLFKRTAVTTATLRKPSDPKPGRKYEVAEVEMDVQTPWNRVEALSLRGEEPFINDYRDRMARQFAADCLRLAFGGTSRAVGSAANYLSVDAGWVEKLRVGNPAAVMSEVIPGSGRVFFGAVKTVDLSGAVVVNVGGGVVGIPAPSHGFKSGAQITISGTTNYNGTYLVLVSSTPDQIKITDAFVAETLAGGAKAVQTPDYKNLDDVVSDLTSILPFEIRGELVCMIAGDVLGQESNRLYGSGTGAPGEKAVIGQSMLTFGGIPLEPVPHIPDGTVIVTPLRNLSIYRKDSWRRAIEVSQERKGVVDWNRFMLSPEVENLDCIGVTENVIHAG